MSHDIAHHDVACGFLILKIKQKSLMKERGEK